jgi:hypothetical protein
MLILGAQVLLGFEFNGAFQSGFSKLPTVAQELKMASLVLMLIAVGLLLTPGAYHQIVERGNDSPRLIDFTNRIAASALLPFASGMGIDVFVAASGMLGPSEATALAIGVTGFALFFWYGLALIVRPGGARRDQGMANETDLSTKIKQVLTEARVVLPGVQALLGFQFGATLMESFATLPRVSQYVHLACLGLLAISIVLLMAPAAFHRIVEHGENTPRMHGFASAMLLSAMVPLALGIAGDSYVVVQKVLQSESVALLVGGLALLLFYGLWFGLTLAIRAAR